MTKSPNLGDMEISMADPIATKLLYVTAGSPEEATKIATTLVEQKLVACANILAPATSIYCWEGSIETATETVFVLKTKAGLVDQTIAKITDLHSYDCPAVVALDIQTGNQEFLNWINSNTK